MKTFRRKFFKGTCHQCEEITTQTRIDESEDESSLSLRCKDCSAVNIFPIERVLNSGRLLTEAEFEERELALSKVVDYDPNQTYWRGQKIRHPVYDEVGKIVDKKTTAGNTSVIVVDFKKQGKKRLVEDYRAVEA